MNFIKKIFLLTAIITLFSKPILKAECISNIYQASFLTTNWLGEIIDKREETTLASSNGFKLKLNKIILCPDSETEYDIGVTFDFLKLDTSNTFHINNKVTQKGLYFKLEKPLTQKTRKLYYFIDASIKENKLLFIYDSQTVKDEDFYNLFISPGINYNYLNIKSLSFFFSTSLSAGLPISGEKGKDLAKGFNLNTYLISKLHKQISLRADFYFEKMFQKVSDTNNKISSLGLGASLYYKW